MSMTTTGKTVHIRTHMSYRMTLTTSTSTATLTMKVTCKTTAAWARGMCSYTTVGCSRPVLDLPCVRNGLLDRACKLVDSAGDCPPGAVPCGLILKGADDLLKGLPGGLDGWYQASACEGGRPLYRRRDSRAGGAPDEELCMERLKSLQHLLACSNT